MRQFILRTILPITLSSLALTGCVTITNTVTPDRGAQLATAPSAPAASVPAQQVAANGGGACCNAHAHGAQSAYDPRPMPAPQCDPRWHTDSRLGGTPPYSDPGHGYPQAGYPTYWYPTYGYPQSGIPQSGCPQCGSPTYGYPQTGDAWSGYPQYGYPPYGYPPYGYPTYGQPRVVYVPVPRDGSRDESGRSVGQSGGSDRQSEGREGVRATRRSGSVGAGSRASTGVPADVDVIGAGERRDESADITQPDLDARTHAADAPADMTAPDDKRRGEWTTRQPNEAGVPSERTASTSRVDERHPTDVSVPGERRTRQSDRHSGDVSVPSERRATPSQKQPSDVSVPAERGAKASKRSTTHPNDVGTPSERGSVKPSRTERRPVARAEQPGTASEQSEEESVDRVSDGIPARLMRKPEQAGTTAEATESKAGAASASKPETASPAPASGTKASGTKASDATATDAKAGDAKAGDAKAGDAKAGDAREQASTTAVATERAAESQKGSLESDRSTSASSDADGRIDATEATDAKSVRAESTSHRGND